MCYYVDGRIDSFIVLFKKYTEWLITEYETSKTDITFTISLPFDSFEDYKYKVNCLLLFELVIITEDDTYIEFFSAMELLNFAQQDLLISGLIYEVRFDERCSPVRINNNRFD